MSYWKYFGEQQGHDGNLFWSQALDNGLPFKGVPPSLKSTELEDKIKVSRYFYAEDFDLSDKAQHTRYRWVMDRIVNGLFVPHFVQRRIGEELGKILIYMEWSQQYNELAPNTKEAMSSITHVIKNKFNGQNIPIKSGVLAGLQNPSEGF